MAVLVKGGGGKPEEEKTVTAGTSVIEVLPSSGKVMKKVTVNPTPTESKEVTAGTSDTTVSPTEGKHLSGVTVHPTPSQEKTVIPTADGFKVSPETGKLLSAVFVDGDSDLVAGNIKQGVNIFGVDGSFDNSHGAYVWKKCKQYIISITQTTSGVNPTLFQVSVSGKELSELESLDGISGTTTDGYEYRFTKTQMLYVGTWYNYTFDNSTGVVSISTGAGRRTLSDCVINEFVDFVVSDNSTAYPDGGEQGGYWYEKVVEGIPIPSGITKFAVDKFTLSADTSFYNGVNVYPSLDVPPRIGIVISPTLEFGYIYNIAGVIGDYKTSTTVRRGFCVASYYNTESRGAETDNSVGSMAYHDDGHLAMASGISHKFKAGVEYTLITMA